MATRCNERHLLEPFRIKVYFCPSFWKEEENCRQSLWAKYQTIVEKALILENLSFSNITSEFHRIELYNVSLKQVSGFKDLNQGKKIKER